MIEVKTSYYAKDQDNFTDILVDADDVTLVGDGDAESSTTFLVLTKGGAEVAWFKTWDHAVKVDSLMEYIDE